MSLRTFLKRADNAVQDTKESVTTAVVIAAVAVVLGVTAIVIAVLK